jgi:hypothetical protein
MSARADLTWLGLRSRSKTGSLALFAAPHRGWQLRRTPLQSLLTVNKPTLIKDISGGGALHPMSAAPAVSMSVRGRLRRCAGKSSSDGNVPKVWEAANTDLSNVFHICSSTAFGLASPLVSPGSIRPRPCRQRKTNPKPSLSHSKAGDPRSRGRALCPAITKLGPVDTAGGPLIKYGCRGNFSFSPVFFSLKIENHLQKFHKKIRRVRSRFVIGSADPALLTSSTSASRQ